MKKFNFMLVMVLGIITAISSSCAKEDPIVKDSYLENSGVATTVEIASNEEGTDFTYESWAVIGQEAKGDVKTKSGSSLVTTCASEGGGTKISVMLTNRFKHSKESRRVSHFHMLDEPVTSIEYDYRGISYEEGFVTIADSVLVYKLDYGCFVERFELFYQVATYSDGITLFNFPHKSYSNFVPDEYIVSNMDSQREEDGKAYSYKVIDHNLNFALDGQNYQMKSSTILRRLIETQGNPFIVRSEVLDSSIQTTDKECEFGEGLILSSNLKVHQVWSDGRTEDKNCPVELAYEVSSDVNVFECNNNPLNQELQNVEYQIETLGDGATSPDASDFALISRPRGTFRMIYPEWEVVFDLSFDYALYDDGVTYARYMAPDISKKNIRIVSDDIKKTDISGLYVHTVVIEMEICGNVLRCEGKANLYYN